MNIGCMIIFKAFLIDAEYRVKAGKVGLDTEDVTVPSPAVDPQRELLFFVDCQLHVQLFVAM